MLTLLISVFWNIAGISTHNHDLYGLASYAAVSSQRSDAHFSRPTAAAPVDPDACPGCAFDNACVSGAVAAFILPPSPASGLPIASLTPRFAFAPTAEPTSRGPPRA